MNTFTNSKIIKKFILVLILLILFSFCYPKTAKAWFEGEDIVAAPAKILWMIEEGLLTFLNNIFTDSAHSTTTQYSSSGSYQVTSLRIYLTPENIIKGKFILFDADIFKEITNNSGYYDYGNSGVTNGKRMLRETIAGWYYALRNFSIVALLSVLAYVGIRMIISTIAQDKAKYKVMFKDWLVALCLVVVMHYMMIGILHITSIINDAIGSSGQNANIIPDLTKDITGILSDEGDKNNYKYNNMDLTDAYAKIIVLAGIIIYTIVFAIKYLKRSFTIIFLILLGPISCITYPIDKISDGKAQAFNKWFTEFLYQVIIQPFHLLLYVVLIGTAADLANVNVLYTIVCFAIMTPAEKFVKSMFGFKEQLSSPLSAAAAGGAMGSLASKAMGALMKGGKGSGSVGKGGGNGGGDSDPSSQLPPKTVDKDNLIGGEDDGKNWNARFDSITTTR